ncbi:nitrate reductase molybdenum cofactor assembly chaperone [Cellulomonas fengjieae]|uniref:Nitrate reductase molybdenum cofactor assembly chaperone n=1 Tax=Cellulomonas fengjieae TaxID=2819978 RepID=A0ABS3SC92_9CELL|nr:nitrate reductase molybdenum cofactor assembly chaperone [Cellulomonas fengjieae]MBO3083370.1 nitrate reductase molybdenum cofactor assembly chaperone [Cellulomonas fengjieae]QVI65288.1 nitrate reductase molybdenum cofactor assembly chaperone [Cellulomonas fengjieae]
MMRDDHTRALTHRVAALLLEYPTAELVAQVPDLRAVASGLPTRAFDPLLDHLARTPLDGPGGLAAEYVETFDLRRKACPYLTYYAYGDTRERGMALLGFKRAFRAAGLEVSPDELPDHLCVVLEFSATADVEAGTRLLLEHRAGLELLRLALVDHGSPWAGALTAVCSTLPPLRGDEREAVARLAAEGPPGESVGLEPYGAMAAVPR